MNISAVLGILLAVAIVWLGVIHPSARPQVFLDSHALLLVCGGTLSAMLLAFPLKNIFRLLRFVIFAVVFKNKSVDLVIAQQILTSYQTLKSSGDRFPLMNDQVHPFLRDALYLLSHSDLSENELHDVLVTRIEYIKKSYLADARMLNALAKFPPAFGLLGASTGMIAMMINLGTGGVDVIGPAMAIALVATFWGIAMANFVLLPLADYAHRLALEETHTRRMIHAAVILIYQQKSMVLLTEKVASYLPLPQRKILRGQIKDKDFEIFSTSEAA